MCGAVGSSLELQLCAHSTCTGTVQYLHTYGLNSYVCTQTNKNSEINDYTVGIEQGIAQEAAMCPFSYVEHFVLVTYIQYVYIGTRTTRTYDQYVRVRTYAVLTNISCPSYQLKCCYYTQYPTKIR